MSGLSKLGYSLQARDTVRCRIWGAAGSQDGFIVIGIRGRHAVRGPEHPHGATCFPTLRRQDAIAADWPDAGEYGVTGIHNHEPTMHSADMVERLRSLPQGRRERGSFHDRLHPDRLSYTLRAGSGNFSPLRPIHYQYDRVVTVRESARLQGFSDDFIWPDRIPRLQQYRQVGNAVPPQLGAAVARCVAQQMCWTLSPQHFKGDAAKRADPISMTDDERVAVRKARCVARRLARSHSLLRRR